MALPVLDGNQSATTLSSVVTGGEHIVAHTVVSLGSNAIANITSAVSGSVVSVSNFPSTQTVAGTVTANVGNVVTSQDSSESPFFQMLPVGGYNWDNDSPKVLSLTDFGEVKVSGTVTANLANVVTNDTFSFAPSVRVMGTGNDGVILQGIDAGGFQANVIEGAAIPVIGRDNAPLPISGTVTIGNSVTIGSLPAISGTVTANAVFATNSFAGSIASDDGGTPPSYAVQLGFSDGVEFRHISPASALPITGTVTVGNSVTIGSLPAISGTVTANNPNGALTTRFGSVTTANTAQLTSAVTNTSRKYLLVQNIASATVTIGIGFAPTTTQGIQLPAGGGLTFDAFTPTGAIYWLSGVTGSNWSILEG